MARSFNGSTDFIDIVGLTIKKVWPTATSRLSFSARANLASGAGSFPMILSPINSDFIFFGVNIGTLSAGGFNLYLNGGESANFTAPSTGIWYQVVATYNGNTASGIKLYVNGASVGGTQVGTCGAALSSNAMKIANGTLGGNSFWKGFLADVAIWNDALTDAEARAFASGVRPGDIRFNSLVGWWPLDGYNHPALDRATYKNNGVLTGTALAVGPPQINPGPFPPFRNDIPKVLTPALVGSFMVFKQQTLAIPLQTTVNATLSVHS